MPRSRRRLRSRFLSTPSARRATQPTTFNEIPEEISIHALREEGDHIQYLPFQDNASFLSTPSARRATEGLPNTMRYLVNFYPRPPRGGRPNAFSSASHHGSFLSTPSARRATKKLLMAQGVCAFLSTPSARRATSASPAFQQRRYHFYPRPPRGGRRWTFWNASFRSINFYPRPPRGGRL